MSLSLTVITIALFLSPIGQSAINSWLKSKFINDFEVELYYSFEKNGVLTNIEDSDSVVEKIDQSYYQELKRQDVIFGRNSKD